MSFYTVQGVFSVGGNKFFRDEGLSVFPAGFGAIGGLMLTLNLLDGVGFQLLTQVFVDGVAQDACVD
jgi:hypothetical protein